MTLGKLPVTEMIFKGYPRSFATALFDKPHNFLFVFYCNHFLLYLAPFLIYSELFAENREFSRTAC